MLHFLLPPPTHAMVETVRKSKIMVKQRCAYEGTMIEFRFGNKERALIQSATTSRTRLGS